MNTGPGYLQSSRTSNAPTRVTLGNRRLPPEVLSRLRPGVQPQRPVGIAPRL